MCYTVSMHFHIWKKHRDILREAGLSRKSEQRIVSFVDHVIFAVAVIGPIMTIPQVVKIWAEQNAAGVSVLTWGTYIFTSLFWLVYGIIHNEKPIIFANIMWIVLSILVVVGTVIYG